MPILWASKKADAGTGFLTMRYAEQLKYSLGYNWGIFREIWDMFTLHKWHWLIVGLLALLCVIPLIVTGLSPVVGYFINTPVPLFDPSVAQDIGYERALSVYYSIVPEPPLLPLVINYHWGMSSAFKPLGNVLCVASMGLLLVAWLREGSPVRGREE